MKNKLLLEGKKYLSKANILITITTLLEILYIYVIVRGALPKLTILIFIIPIFIYNIYFYKYINKILPKFEFKRKKVLYFCIVIILGLMFYKSITLKSVFIQEGIMTVPYILGAIAFYIQFILIMTCLLEKISFKKVDNEKKWYTILLFAIPSLLIFTFVYFVYFPGLCSADTLHIWTNVGDNIFSDMHPIIYMFLIKFLRILWNDIAVIALFQLILCSFTFAFVTNELYNMGTPKWVCILISIMIPLLPANAMYAITMWKDVPYTMGLIILCMLILRCMTSDYYYSKRALPQMYIVALFTLFMRHNALLSVLLSLFVFGVYYIYRYVKYKKDFKLIIKTLILGVALLVSFFGIKNIAFSTLESEKSTSEYTGSSMISKAYFPTTIASQQILYTEHLAGTSFNHLEREYFKRFFNEEGVASHKEKYGANDIWQYYHKPLITTNTSEFGDHTDIFWKYYFRLWVKFPRSMFGGYEKITSINWASSNYGSVAYRGTVTANVEGLDQYEYRPIIQSSMNYTLDKSVFAYISSSMSIIFWRPAFALLLMLLFCHVAYRKHGVGAIYMILPVIFNQLTYFMVTASQDVRYTYINFTMVIVMFVLALILKPQFSAENEATISGSRSGTMSFSKKKTSK